MMQLHRTYRIETERLVIRCYNPTDAPLLHAALRDSLNHIRPWLPWAKYEPLPLEARIERLRHFRGQFDLGQDYVFGIFNPDETQLIGSTGLHTRQAAHGREIGYWIHAHHIQKGYATEATAALTKIGFEIENLAYIEIRCVPENIASQSVPKKLGYTLEGVLKNRLQSANETLQDSMIWTMLREEYKQSSTQSMPLRAFDAAGNELLMA